MKKTCIIGLLVSLISLGSCATSPKEKPIEKKVETIKEVAKPVDEDLHIK